jgi:hypothetical protein
VYNNREIKFHKIDKARNLVIKLSEHVTLALQMTLVFIMGKFAFPIFAFPRESI